MLWILIVVLVVLVWVFSLYRHGLNQRQNLSSYVALLLLDDATREDHKRKLVEFIRNKEGPLVSVAAAAHVAIGRMADDLDAKGSSLLTAQSLIAAIRSRGE